MSNSKILYGLACGHGAPGPDTLVNGSLECAWHRERSQIIEVITWEWCSKCRSCTHITWAGLSKHNAMMFAQGHSRRNPDHVVGPEYRINPNAERTARKMRAWKVRNGE